MKAQQLLSLVPAMVLEELAIETKVNRYAKKLQGEVIFKLLLHCLLTQKGNSLRGMSSAYEAVFFRFLNRGLHKGRIAISSISERLNTIEAGYFEKLYHYCVRLYKQRIGKKAEELIRFDSTIVALSTKLLDIGYHLKGGDAENYRQLKFTVGYSNGIAETVNFYTDQGHNSENLALREAILQQAEKNKKTIKVFDKGITARKTYDTLTQKDIVFVSLINSTAKHDKMEPHSDGNNLTLETDTLKIISDQWCQLYGEGKKKAAYLVRRIEAVRLSDKEVLTFITNTADLSAKEVTEIYKSRWTIEVFFRFIKQLLNFKHLLNRTENGIKVVLYVTMIAAVLLETYKRSNNMSGYKIPMLKFTADLEEEMIKKLIILCGGNPEQLNVLFNTDSS